VSTAEELPTAPAQLAKVLGSGSINEIIGGLSSVPGLNLVPGVYTLSTLAQNNWNPGALLQHPVYSALDILPFAHDVLPVSSIADSVVTNADRFPETAARVAADQSALQAINPETGLTGLDQSNITRIGAGLQPEAMPSPFVSALRTSPTLTEWGTTSPFLQKLQSSFGSQTRDLAQCASGVDNRLQMWADPNLPIDHPALENAPEVLRNAITDMAQYRTMPSVDQQTVFDLMEHNNLNDVLATPGLSDQQMALANSAAEHAQNLAEFAVNRDWLARDPVTGEIYMPRDYNTIQNARNDVTNIGVVNDVANGLTNPTPGVLPDYDPARWLDENVKVGVTRTAAQGFARWMESNGFDGQAIRDAANEQASTKESIVRAAQDAMANPRPSYVLPPEDIIDRLDPHVAAESAIGEGAERGSAATRVRQAIRRDDYQEAAQVFRETLGARQKFIFPDADIIQNSLNAYREGQKFLDRRGADFSDRVLARAQQAQTDAERSVIPAKYYSAVEKYLYNPAEHTGLYYQYFSDDPEAIRLLNKGLPQLIPALQNDSAIYREMEQDAIDHIANLRENGFNPTFMHRVSPQRGYEIVRPKVTDTLPTPTSIRERTLNSAPYHHDVSIAVSHQAAEFMRRQMMEEELPRFMQLFTKDQPTVINEVLPAAERLAKGDPEVLRAEIDRLIGQGYEPWDQNRWFGGGPRGLPTMAPTAARYIPQALANGLDEMFGKHPYRFAQILDRPMRVFRKAVIDFSPRRFAHNVVGGLITMGMEDPRILTYMSSHWPEIRDFVRSGGYDVTRGLPPAGYGLYQPEVDQWIGRTTPAQRLAAIHDYNGGRTVARWLGEAQGVGGTALDKINAGGAWINSKVAAVDQMYRAAAYLYGRDKQLAAGMTDDAARSAGEALVRKTMPEWDRYTPFERTVLRTYLPFYPFMKFVTGYALHYPINHPFRTAVMASLVRQEMNDYASGWLPLDFAKMFFVGKPDSRGNVTAINPGRFNPFEDVANMASLTGILGQTNPFIAAAMKSLGYDPAKGTQDLYPDVSYNPNTGTLVPSNPNFISSLIGQFVPQSQAIAALVGHNADFAGMLEANPDAARNMLESNLGIPAIFRTVNLPQAAFKAEVQREAVQQQVRNQALKSGDWSRALTFPGLRPYFANLAQTFRQNPQALKAYQSQVRATTLTDVLTSSPVGSVSG